MKRWIKLICWILCFALMLQIPVNAVGTNDPETIEHMIPVSSNLSEKQYARLLERDGQYYLSAEDISSFTRCQYGDYPTVISMMHGIREIVIDKAACTARDYIYWIAEDQNIERELPVSVIEHEGSYYFEAIPMLMYMGATCAIINGGCLSIWMPQYTIYEAILDGYWNWKIDLEDLYGSQENIDSAIACAVWADFFDFINGEGIQTTFDVHIENAMYEILNVEAMEYPAVQMAAAETLEQINDYLTIVGTERTSVLSYFVAFLLDEQAAELGRGEFLYQLKSIAGDSKEASRISKELNQQLYEHLEAEYVKDKASGILDASLLALDVAATSYNRIKYDESTKYLFANTLNDRVLRAAHSDIKFRRVTDQIIKDLSSTQNIIASTAAQKITKYVSDTLMENGFEKALEFFTSSANLYAVAVELGATIGSLCFYKQNEAFSAEMNAIILGRFQESLSYVLKHYYHYACEDGANLTDVTFEDYRNLLILYYRATIAFHENMAVAVAYFDHANGQSRANGHRSSAETFANYLYRITNCAMVPLAEREDLEQSLITAEWIESVSVDSGAGDLEAYREILDMYCTSISCNWSNRDGEGWEEVGDPDNACYIFGHYLSEYTLSQVGYALDDVDGNGTAELFVAPLDLGETGEFYELYTISNGSIVHTVSAGERDQYYLAEDRSINNQGSGGALSSSRTNYRLDPATGKLKVNQAVIYDGWIDPENPWFYTEQEYYNAETYETDHTVLKPITEEEALQIWESFPEGRPLEWTSFEAYLETLSKTGGSRRN